MATLERILVNGVTEILKKLVPFIIQNIRLAKGFKAKLKNLQETLEMVLTVIEDAEEKQVNDKAVRIWLKRLKDVAYEADDVLDDFSYEITRRKCVIRCNKDKVLDFVSKSSNPLIYGFRMGRRISNINEKLHKIVNDANIWSKLQPKTSSSSSSSGKNQNNERQRRETPSYVDDSEIVGRRDDKRKIIDLLMNVSLSSGEKLPAVCIVGMGGLGKTTLAQHIYNDDVVKKHFEPRVWMCVSDDDSDFDAVKVLKDILRSITKSNSDEVNVDVVLRQVHTKLKDKKYLLVLDDLWNDNVHEWEKLKGWLDVGLQGSRVLITTRKNQVALTVRCGISAYYLQQLSDDECWFIVKRRAFAPGGALEFNLNMTKLGKEVSRKCYGVPLVAKTLGSLLYLNNEERDWISISRNQILDTSENQSRVMHILRYSYNHLPSHLKQCFAFCSIFPKDWIFKRETLIRLWIAEGFILQLSYSDGNEKSLEDIGNDYFNSLLFNSLFQDVKMDDNGIIASCKMHDLIHDLAKSVAENHEYSVVKVSNSSDFPEVRNLGLIFDVSTRSIFAKPLYDIEKLRTVLTFRTHNCQVIDLSSFSNPHLRVLDLSGTIVASVSSIANMRLLRYLVLPELPFRDPEAMQCICTLYNLQTLVLHIPYLRELPNEIGNLKALRHLRLIESRSLEVLPESITSLSNLQTFNLYESFALETLPIKFGALKNLKELFIIFSEITSLPESITKCSNLKKLILKGCSYIKSLPEDLGALKELRCLNLKGTGITQLPRSLSSCSHLEILDLNSCANLEELPKDLGDLKCLKVLDIYATRIKELPSSVANLYNLKWLDVGSSFLEELPRDMGNLRHLSFLDLSDTNIRVLPDQFCSVGLCNLEYANLSKCDLPKDIQHWTKLKHFKYEGHRDETPLGVGQLTCLQTLEEYVVRMEDPEVGGGVGELGGLNLLAGKLSVYNLENVKGGIEEAQRANLKEKQGIRDLKLHWGNRSLGNDGNDEAVLEGLQPHLNLEKLSIDGFNGVNLPSWMLMSSISFCLGNLVWIELRKCNRCEQLQGLGKLPHLISLILYEIPNLKEWMEPVCHVHPISAGLTQNSSPFSLFPSLAVLHIISCPQLTMLPAVLFPSLERLTVKLSNVKVLNSFMTGLSSLIILEIVGVSDLEFLPRQILQSKLEVLEIWGCPKFQGFQQNEEDKLFNISATPDNNSFDKWIRVQSLIIQFPKSGKTLSRELQHINIQGTVKIGWFSEEPGSFPFSLLRKLEIDGCYKLRALPEQLQYLTMLEDLSVFNMGQEFVTLPAWSGNLSSLKFLQIRNCIGLVYLLPEESIRRLTLLWCLRIHGISEEPEVFLAEAQGIQHFISLHSLEIHGWSKLNALPHQLQHLINLKKLVVEDFDGLVDLPEWVGHLLSLKELVLRSCKNLMHLPSKKAMQRLIKLCAISIKACPLLEERCAYKTGEEWEKISHIEEISIG